MRTSCRLATAGQPIERVAVALRAALPTQGQAAAGAVRIASTTGGKTAAVFDSLAVIAREEAELAGERAAAAAQARLSAAIVAGIPVAVLVVAGLTGRLGDLISGGPVGMVMVALGVGLLATGSAWVIGLLRRGRG
jgi:Flp pilus assembly protein TadB